MLSIFDHIITFLPVYQAILFSFVFFVKYLKHKQQHFLIMGFFMLVATAYFSMSFLYYYKVYDLVAQVFPFTVPITLLFMPLFYLFADFLTSPKKRFGETDYWHFLPSLIMFLIMLPYMFESAEDKLHFVSGGYGDITNSAILKFTTWIFRFGVFIIINLQFAIYLFLYFQLIKKHKNTIERYFSFKENIDLEWLTILVIVFVLFFLVIDISRFIGTRNDIFMRLLSNLSTLSIILYIGIKTINQIPIYDSFRNKESLTITQEQIIQKEHNEELNQPEIKEKYAHSNLTNELKEILITELEKYMQEKPYNNIQLTIEDVADTLDTNTRYISQIINEHYKMNFYNFINNYRINDAIMLIRSGENNRYSLDGIARMVGFNSKSSFNTSFKKITGTTPSEYRRKEIINC